MSNRKYVHPIAVGLVLVGLAGCSVSLDDPQSSQSADSPSAAGSASAESADGAEGADGAQSETAEGDPWREALLAQATQTLTCNGTLTIDDISTTVHVTGDCEQLIVNGTSVAVLADRVESLDIDGVNMLAVVSSVSQLSIDGSSIDVYWSDGSDPTVTNNGIDINFGTTPAFDPEELP